MQNAVEEAAAGPGISPVDLMALYVLEAHGALPGGCCHSDARDEQGIEELGPLLGRVVQPWLSEIAVTAGRRP